MPFVDAFDSNDVSAAGRDLLLRRFPAESTERRWGNRSAERLRGRGGVGGDRRMDYRETREIRDGMRIEWDMPIPMDDGIVLRADIFRPIADGRYPAIMTYGPYGKGLHLEDL